jgi:hypothetical protein
VDLALSVRALSTLPVSVITGPEGGRMFERHYRGLFDHVIVEERLGAMDRTAKLVAAKIVCLRRSPYDISAFLDSDMVCRRNPEFLLEGIGVDGFRVFGRRHDRVSAASVVHHGIAVRNLFEQFGMETYVHSSLGAFAFGAEAAKVVADSMEREEAQWREKIAPFRDDLPAELLFGLIERQDIVSFFDLPASGLSFRWSDDAAFIHSAPMRHAEARKVIAGVVRLRSSAGYRVGPSIYWIAEILGRRAEQAGLSRRQAKFMKSLCRLIYERATT